MVTTVYSKRYKKAALEEFQIAHKLLPISPKYAVIACRISTEAVLKDLIKEKAPDHSFGKDSTIYDLMAKAGNLNLMNRLLRMNLSFIQKLGNFGAHHQDQDEIIDEEFAKICITHLTMILRQNYPHVNLEALPNGDQDIIEQEMIKSQRGQQPLQRESAPLDSFDGKIHYMKLPPNRSKPLRLVMYDASETQISKTVTSWKSVLIEFVSTLINEEQARARIGWKRTDRSSKTLFSQYNQTGDHRYKLLYDGVYLNTNYSARDIMRNIHALIDDLELPIECYEVFYNLRSKN